MRRDEAEAARGAAASISGSSEGSWAARSARGSADPALPLSRAMGNRAFAAHVAAGRAAEGPGAVSPAIAPAGREVLARSVGSALSAVGARAAGTALAAYSAVTGIGFMGMALAYSRQFARDLDRIEYDEETRRTNEARGRTEGHFREALFDAWGYCYIAAWHARTNPSSMTWLGGHAYDLIAQGVASLKALGHGMAGNLHALMLPEPDTTAADVHNRDVGIEIGSNDRLRLGRDIYQECFDAMMSGRLDLTHAGVARGRRLRYRAGR